VVFEEATPENDRLGEFSYPTTVVTCIAGRELRVLICACIVVKTEIRLFQLAYMSPVRKPFCQEDEGKIEDRRSEWANDP